MCVRISSAQNVCHNPMNVNAIFIGVASYFSLGGGGYCKQLAVCVVLKTNIPNIRIRILFEFILHD